MLVVVSAINLWYTPDVDNEIEAERLGAWEALIRTVGALLKTFERELQESEGLPLPWYGVLIQLHEAPERRLRMQALADSVVLSRSGPHPAYRPYGKSGAGAQGAFEGRQAWPLRRDYTEGSANVSSGQAPTPPGYLSTFYTAPRRRRIFTPCKPHSQRSGKLIKLSWTLPGAKSRLNPRLCTVTVGLALTTIAVLLMSADSASAHGDAGEIFRGREGSYEIIARALPEEPVVGSVHFSITPLEASTALPVSDAKILIIVNDQRGQPTYQARGAEHSVLTANLRRQHHL